jgi:hypothetical protein
MPQSRRFPRRKGPFAARFVLRCVVDNYVRKSWHPGRPAPQIFAKIMSLMGYVSIQVIVSIEIYYWQPRRFGSTACALLSECCIVYKSSA